MATNIGGGVTYLSREDWGANPLAITRGHVAVPTQWERITYHHTVIIDNDATPDLWPNAAKVKVKMRQLQVIRPDLGSEVPYSFVHFLMEDGGLYVCEGRGTRRTGAHTIGHNSTWLGVAFEGDFENFRQDIRRWIPKVNHFAWWIRNQGCRNLRKPFMVHQDTSQTACPGSEVISRRSLFSYAELVTVGPPPEEEDMPDLQARAAIDVLITSAHLQQAELDAHSGQIDFLAAIVRNHEQRLSSGLPVDTAAVLADFKKRLDESGAARRALAIKITANAKKLAAAAEALA